VVAQTTIVMLLILVNEGSHFQFILDGSCHFSIIFTVQLLLFDLHSFLYSFQCYLYIYFSFVCFFFFLGGGISLRCRETAGYLEYMKLCSTLVFSRI
jgi:hypothetical protein